MPPQADWIPGVDGSYTRLTPEAAAQLRASGELVWWQCLWTGSEQPAYRIENLRIAIAAGMIPLGYISVTWACDGAYHVGQGRAGVPDDLWAALILVPVDVELAGIPWATVRQAVDLLATPAYGGKRRAIYSSYQAWVDYLGNPSTFRDCLLVNALWDQDPDIDFANLPYGGWTLAQLVGEQYNGGTEIAGVYVDLDMFNRNLLLEGIMANVPLPTNPTLTDLLLRWAGMILSGDDQLMTQAYMEMKFIRGLAGKEN
jgi:hypothetical protein